MTKIGLFETLNPGDKIRLVISPRAWLGETIGSYITAAKIYAAMDDPRYKILNWETIDSGIALNIEIVKPPDAMYTAGISAGMIAIIIVGSFSIALVSVSVWKVTEKLTDPENPNAVAIASGIKWTSIALVGGAVWLLWKVVK